MTRQRGRRRAGALPPFLMMVMVMVMVMVMMMVMLVVVLEMMVTMVTDMIFVKTFTLADFGLVDCPTQL